eukprot:CAMPEP_0115042622 /NCGR_PEP_ID=MMETSP0216-20121206/46375_1 /TAXON_ID=223996 /ORGANISM="Protocruzia adherens, Strain Boccale" /LENGTH=134 /DNA_ID=CAMNT_0002424771 /DNA_START=698 /DNA_END=1098 /DNA_ORIENTATION=+
MTQVDVVKTSEEIHIRIPEMIEITDERILDEIALIMTNAIPTVTPDKVTMIAATIGRTGIIVNRETRDYRDYRDPRDEPYRDAGRDNRGREDYRDPRDEPYYDRRDYKDTRDDQYRDRRDHRQEYRNPRDDSSR